MMDCVVTCRSCMFSSVNLCINAETMSTLSGMAGTPWVRCGSTATSTAAIASGDAE